MRFASSLVGTFWGHGSAPARIGLFFVAALLVGTPLVAASDLTTSSSYGTAYQNQRRMVRASTGTLALVYQKGSPATKGGGLVLAISRDGGASWTVSINVATLSNVFADAFIAANNDIYLTYATNDDGAGALKDVNFAKLRYVPETDSWVLDHWTMVFDASTSTGGYNSIITSEDGYLWLAFRRYEGSQYSFVVYHSTDDGQTWNYDLQADPPGPNADETGVFEHFGNKVALVFYHQNFQFRWRWRTVGDPPGAWSPSALIYQVPRELGSKSDYSIVADDNQRMHLIFAQQGVKYLVYDGVDWTHTPVVIGPAGADPSLTTDGTDLWALWQQPVGNYEFRVVLQQYHGNTSVWDSTVVGLNDPDEQIAARAWCFGAGTFTDVTLAASNTIKNDVKNAVTGVMLKSVDDAFYFGATVPFDYLRFELKTYGSGGVVAWDYWNGGAWSSFNPVSGSNQFIKSTSVILWPETADTPSDWSPTSVEGSAPLYYVRARVTTAYSTAPIGAQITSLKRSQFPVTMHRDQEGLVAVWTRGMRSPYTIVTHLIAAWGPLGHGPLASAAASPRSLGSAPAIRLFRNAPNPFNPETSIRYELPRESRVSLTVYDVSGRRVRRLVDEVVPAGMHEARWTGRDDEGNAVSSGVYLYRLDTEGAVLSGRMVLVK